MTGNGLAAFYRRYNACCNEHRFEDLREFVARDVVINGTDRGLDGYAEALRSVVRGFPDYRWELRHLLVDGRGSPHTSRTRERTAAPSTASSRQAAA